MAKYQSVNGRWPEGTNDGRDLKPTPQEAVAGAKRLYRIAMGRPWKGPVKLTSGNRYTYPRSGVLYVNPDWRNGGWHEIVHLISHYAAYRLHKEAHGPRHAFIERELITAVVSKGWLEGKLVRKARPPKAKPDAADARLQRLRERLVGWQRRHKRAATAIRKLEKQVRYYEKKRVPPGGRAEPSQEIVLEVVTT